MGHVFLGLLVTRLTGLHAFPIDVLQKSLILGVIKQALFILGQPRPHNRVRRSVTTKISSLGTSLLQ